MSVGIPASKKLSNLMPNFVAPNEERVIKKIIIKITKIDAPFQEI